MYPVPALGRDSVYVVNGRRVHTTRNGAAALPSVRLIPPPVAQPGVILQQQPRVLLQQQPGHLPVLPASGYVSLAVDPAGFLRHLALPTLTLGIALAASSLRITRAAMLEILGADFIRTARAKGLRQSAVLRRHALPNAMVPIVTLLGIQMGQLFGGVVVTETLFAWPGLGKLTVDAVFARDYPVVQGAVLVTATLFLLINLLTDLLYTQLDVRIGSVAGGGAS